VGARPAGSTGGKGGGRVEGTTRTCGQVLGDSGSTVDGDPTLDSDGDRINDADDNCPLAMNLDQADEDGDATGDACDLCPVVSSTLLPGADDDPDGDRIGAACDPRPSAATETMLLFEPFNGSQVPTMTTTYGLPLWSVSQGQLVANLTDPNQYTTLAWTLAFSPTMRSYAMLTSVAVTGPFATGTSQVEGAGIVGGVDGNGGALGCSVGVFNQEPSLIAVNVTAGSDTSIANQTISLSTDPVDLALFRSPNQLQCTTPAANIPGVPAPASQNTNSVGIHARGTTASFRFLYVVDSPI